MKLKAFASTYLRAAAAGGALLLVAGQAAAQSATADVQASATLVRTLAVTGTSGLSFGTLAPTPTAGSVVMSPAGVRQATGGVMLVSSNTGSAGAVNLSGSGSLAYTVSMPSSVTLTATGDATQTMTLNNLTNSLNSNAGTLGTDGNGSFNVGGTLVVAANQFVAAYSGQMSITINWN